MLELSVVLWKMIKKNTGGVMSIDQRLQLKKFCFIILGAAIYAFAFFIFTWLIALQPMV